MFWDENALRTAINILNRSHTVVEAAEELSVRYGNVTASSLRSALRKAGYRSPSFYLNTVPENSLTYDISVIEYPSTASLEPIYKIMVCPDAHHPYVDQTAWRVFLTACKVIKPDALVIIGDFADVLSLSAHPKSPKDEKSFKSEFAKVKVALDQVSDLDIHRVIFCEGNHENRITRYIAKNAPELDDMMTVQDLLGINERGWEFVPYGEYIRIGEINFSHDVGRCGVNAARQSLADFGSNIVFGHSHRGAVVYSGTVEGRTHVGMNVGCLLDINQVSYTNRAIAKREWTHGFGLIYQDHEGVGFCNFVPIINGRCVADGKLITQDM